MSINIGPPSVEELRPRITVIGVGGAGGNAIANMIGASIDGVEFIVANTDAQALNNSIAETRLQLGPDITQGLGAGSRPEVGRAAAEETVSDIERALEGVNMVFIAAGMGGGTGTGAAPVIAEVARRKGVLTVGVVTKPFQFEGSRRMRAAEAGIEELQKHVDTLIVIPNQNLFLIAKAETTFKEAFQLADEVLQQGVRSITDLMVMPGLINLDFADVRSVMGEMGKAMMGTGEGEGENRALQAAELAIANPLLDGVSMRGAKGVIISIIGGDDMKLLEVDEAANHIRELVDPEANIIWGSAFNPDLEGKIRVSVVATGIEQSDEQAYQASQPLNFGASRGPKRPSLPLAGEAAPMNQMAAPEPAYQSAPEPEPDVLDLPAEFDESDDGEYDEADDAAYELSASDEDATDGGSTGGVGEDAPFELTLDSAADEGESAGPVEPASRLQDELLLDADRLVDKDEPVQDNVGGRRRAILGGAASESPPANSGSTLFERMANLSRGAAKSEDKDEEDEDEAAGPSLSIPRFLGRQNNQ